MKGCIARILIFSLVLAWGMASADGIYTWTDAQGRVHFGDKPAENDQAETVNVQINTFESVTYQSLDKG
ncbi:DUF4124 domain-containing protein, partial [Alcanivorax sp. HI0003]